MFKEDGLVWKTEFKINDRLTDGFIVDLLRDTPTYREWLPALTCSSAKSYETAKQLTRLDTFSEMVELSLETRWMHLLRRTHKLKFIRSAFVLPSAGAG